MILLREIMSSDMPNVDWKKLKKKTLGAIHQHGRKLFGSHD